MAAKKLPHRDYNAYEQVVYNMEKPLLEALPTAVLKLRKAFDVPFLRIIPGTNAVFDATNDVLEAREKAGDAAKED